jgi:hypothetical protein
MSFKEQTLISNVASKVSDVVRPVTQLALDLSEALKGPTRTAARARSVALVRRLEKIARE